MSLSLSQAKAFKCTAGGTTKRLHDPTGQREPKSQFFYFSVHRCFVSIVTNNFDLKDNFIIMISRQLVPSVEVFLKFCAVL